MTPPRLTLPLGLCICRDHQCQIPYGTCHCGCGTATKISAIGNAALGYVAGIPRRYANGHNSPLNAKPREPISFGEVGGEKVAFIPLTQGKKTIVDADQTHLFGLNLYYRKGYALSTINGKSVKLHYLIFNCPNGLEPDHHNRNRLDNRRSNLRLATRKQQMHNAGPHENHSSLYKGVSETSWGKFRARIKGNGVDRSLGCFVIGEEAAVAYDREALRLYGEYAYLNFPERQEEYKKWLTEGING